MPYTDDQLRAIAAHHAPRTERRVELHSSVRAATAEYLVLLNQYLPESPEKDAAILDVQHGAQMAHAALAIHEDRIDEVG